MVGEHNGLNSPSSSSSSSSSSPSNSLSSSSTYPSCSSSSPPSSSSSSSFDCSTSSSSFRDKTREGEAAAMKVKKHPLQDIKAEEAQKLGFMREVHFVKGLPFKAIIRQVPGDGKCLFHAVCSGLWYSLYGSHVAFNYPFFQDLTWSLRQLAVDTLEDPSRDILMMEGDEIIERSYLLQSVALKYRSTPQNYCTCMRQNGAWGGGPEIIALSNALQRPIIVYEPRKTQNVAAEKSITQEESNGKKANDQNAEIYNNTKTKGVQMNHEYPNSTQTTNTFYENKQSKAGLLRSFYEYYSHFLENEGQTQSATYDSHKNEIDKSKHVIEPVGLFGWPMFNDAECIHVLFLEDSNHFNAIFPH